MSNGILVIGSVNYDFIYQVEKLPAPHQTIPAQGFTTAPGGKGANQAAAAARATDNPVKLLGCVGADIHADACLTYLKETGVELSDMVVAGGHPTGTACILVEQSGDNLIVVSAGANAALTRKHLEDAQEAIEASDILLFQLEVPLPTVMRGLQIGRRFGKKTILNPAPYISGVEEMLPLVDVFTPNQPEAEAMTGAKISTVAGAEAAAKVILEKGANEAIITLGGEGCLVATQSLTRHLPAYNVPTVIDTSGAGDVFNGALAGALGEGANLVDAADFASACAALSVTKPTASNCAPSHSEALAFQQNSV